MFVTVDPERDTTSWLADYSRYTPRGFAFVTGSDQQISQTAAAWNVRYARVDTTTPGEYEMTHTADVYAIDAAGTLRAHFPFGTDAADDGRHAGADRRVDGLDVLRVDRAALGMVGSANGRLG